MKKIILTPLLCFMLLVAMSQPVKKTGTIREEEVPVAIRKAFIVEFGSIPENGTWTVNFHVVQEGNKTTAKPTGYIFSKGGKRDKVEVRYSPEGKLVTAKGMKRLS